MLDDFIRQGKDVLDRKGLKRVVSLGFKCSVTGQKNSPELRYYSENIIILIGYFNVTKSVLVEN